MEETIYKPLNHVFDKRLLFKYVKNSNTEIILKK